MNKEQRLQSFWRQFGEAYDEASVPDSAGFPRITYEGVSDYFDRPVPSTASIWSRSTSWQEAETLKERISQAITRGGVLLPYDNGNIWLKMGTPWAQRMPSEDDSIRRIVLQIELEFNE